MESFAKKFDQWPQVSVSCITVIGQVVAPVRVYDMLVGHNYIIVHSLIAPVILFYTNMANAAYDLPKGQDSTFTKILESVDNCSISLLVRRMWQNISFQLLRSHHVEFLPITKLG